VAQDLSAGKTPAQLFSSDCSACHHLPNGLCKKYNTGSLTDFLRAHYTTKPDSAGALARYVTGFATLRAAPVTAPSAEEGVEELKARGRASNLSSDGEKPLRPWPQTDEAPRSMPAGLSQITQSNIVRSSAMTRPTPSSVSASLSRVCDAGSRNSVSMRLSRISAWGSLTTPARR
jgi:hypothetical protein